MTHPFPPLAAIILAAGKGTRMKSQLHKVLHPVGGRPMLLHLLDTVAGLRPSRLVVVVGDRAEQVAATVTPLGAEIAIQAPQLGTGHAVQQAEPLLSGFEGDVLILFGDAPLVETATLARLRATLDAGTGLAVLGFRPRDPGAYGRILAGPDGVIERMVEARDASPEELAHPLCNAGLMAVRAGLLWPLLAKLGNSNAAGEYYLPDIVMLARADGVAARVIEADESELLGVNSRADLALVEAAFQARRRAELMASGVTLVAPETVFLAFDTRLGPDSLVEPFVVFGPGVSLGPDCRVRAHSHIEGAVAGKGCDIGPFARLRPGTRLGESVRIGNFVETKKAELGDKAKANHLSYLGDTTVGAGANIGAGTITCNYDGYSKHRTEIGARAFIGSNSALVAPVTIGEAAIVGAGSVITADVAAGDLALGRAPQESLTGWAMAFHAKMAGKED